MSEATSHDLLLEQMAEEIDAHPHAFTFFTGIPSWTGVGHYDRLHELMDGLVDHGHLRRLDLRTGETFIRTDVTCDIEEPVQTVYRAFDADNNLLYVGCTSKPIGLRLKAHAKTKAWWAEVTHVSQEPVIGWTRGLAAERTAIENEAPRHNVIHNRKAA